MDDMIFTTKKKDLKNYKDNEDDYNDKVNISNKIYDYIFQKLTYDKFIPYIKRYDIFYEFSLILIGRMNKFISPKRRNELNKIIKMFDNKHKNVSGNIISNLLQSYIKMYQFDLDTFLNLFNKSELLDINHNNENILYVAINNLDESIMDIDTINTIILQLIKTNDVNLISNKYPYNSILILLFKKLKTIKYSSEVIESLLYDNFTFAITDDYGRTALDYCIINYFTKDYYNKDLILQIINSTLNKDNYLENFYDEKKIVDKRYLFRISKENLPNFILITYGMNDRYIDDYQIVSQIIYSMYDFNNCIYDITSIGAALQGNIFEDVFYVNIKKKYYFNDIINYILENTSDAILNKNYDSIVENKKYNLIYDKPENFYYRSSCQYDISYYVESNYDIDIIKKLFTRIHKIEIESFFFILNTVKFNSTKDYELMDLLIEKIDIVTLKTKYEYQLVLIAFLFTNSNDYDEFLFKKTNHQIHQRKIHYILSRSLITPQSIQSDIYKNNEYVFGTYEMKSAKLYLITCFEKYFDSQSQYLLIEILRLYDFNVQLFFGTIDSDSDMTIVENIVELLQVHLNKTNILIEFSNNMTDNPENVIL
jgi:hypothetical protein